MSPKKDQEVEKGDDITFEITPNDGYQIADVLVDGKSVGAVDEYTFENVKKDHKIEAKFEKQKEGIYKITVKAGTNGIILPNKDQEVKKGENMKFEISAANGYQIADVLVDGESVGAVLKYTFTDVKKDHKIEAKFEKIKEETKNKKTFKDVKKEDWFYDSVNYAVDKELFNGISEDEFAPNIEMNRAMIVTVLHRLSNKEQLKKAVISMFKDVEENQYYTEAVKWAVENEIVNGMGNGEFAPLNNVTREQIVVILYRYAKKMGKNLSADIDLTKYEDLNEVSDYALEAFKWAVKNNIISGRTSKTLVPKGTATRAEVATILMRFAEGK